VKCPQQSLSIAYDKVLWDKRKCQKCDICLKTCSNNSSPKALLMDTEEIVTEIKKVKSFINGITVSGGECMLQTDFLFSLFTEVKNMGLNTFVDTNGSIPFWEYKDLLEVMDKAMVDVKSFDPTEHKKLTSMDNVIVLKNVEFLGKIGKLYEIRTVIVPDILDNYFNVDSTSKFLAKINPSVRYKLIKYRQLGVRKNFVESRTPTDAMMNELSEIAKYNGCTNIVIT
jgi:YjjW family glycine radical enzyme activase